MVAAQMIIIIIIIIITASAIAVIIITKAIINYNLEPSYLEGVCNPVERSQLVG